MSTYYIDPENGHGTGNSVADPAASDKCLDIQPGDHVLFRRNTRVYGQIVAKNGTSEMPVLYGAYGEGKDPVFCGCVDISAAEAWEQTENNIWECTKRIPYEACNVIFDDGIECGTLKWSKDLLTEEGDWYDNRIGTHECVADSTDRNEEQHVFLYCTENPGLHYHKIECATREFRYLAGVWSNVIIENICFEKNGVHGISCGGENIVIRNCTFFLIGGCVWSKDLKIRFGNGVEFWEISKNVAVEHCVFDDIYDSGVTHQGADNCQITENAHFEYNTFHKCGMAAYEARDLVPRNTTFSHNICTHAGEGFSKNGVVMPRNSEIWPQPMGHHVFIWRMDHPTEGGSLQIRDNEFGDTLYGAPIYSIIAPEAEEQISIDNNCYSSGKYLLIAHVKGRDFLSFEEYQRESGYEKAGVYK